MLTLCTLSCNIYHNLEKKLANRTGNYTAFYVDEPFNESNLGASATKDFVTYNLLRAWKGKDSSFPFVDSHDKTIMFVMIVTGRRH